MKRTILSTTLASLLTLAGGHAQALDLLQAYQAALSSDAQFAVARSTVASGREKTEQGRSALMPTVNASASRFRNDVDSTGTTALTTRSSTFDTSEYKLSAVQPLFRWQNWVGYQQGDLQVAQAEANFAQAQQDLILRVAEAYFAVLNAQESLKATEAQKAAIAQQLALAKKSFEVGTATITDTHEAQARFDLVVAQEIAAQNQLEVARQSLAVVLGKEPGALASLKPGAKPTAPQPAVMQEWVAQAEQNNVQVRVQQLSADLAAKSSESARAGHYPTLDLIATYAINQNDLYKNATAVSPYETKTLAVGIQLNVPLFAGGSTQSKSREAAYQRDAALSGLDSARRQAALSARSSYLGVVNGVAQVTALEAAVVSSQSALTATKVGYEVGVRINNDVLNAEQQYHATLRDLHKAKLDALLARLKLKAAAGSLHEDDVREINALLDAS